MIKDIFLKRWVREIGAVLLIVAGLFGLSSWVDLRFDLTEDGRYTLTDASLAAVSGLRSETLEIDVLLGNNLPEPFPLLRQEVDLLLAQYSARHGSLRVDFFDPLEEEEDPEAALNNLLSLGMNPFTVTRGGASGVTQENVFPWAVVTWKGRSVRVPLLRKTIGASLEQRIDQSVQELEYAFADAFRKLGLENRKRLGLVDGQGEWSDPYIADFMGAAGEYYELVRVSLDSSGLEPEVLLDSLRTLDAIVIARPQRAYNEEKRYLLDQYLASGGNALFLLDPGRIVEPGPESGLPDAKPVAIWDGQELDELFFHVGLRMQRGLVADLYATPIVLASGEGRDTQYNPLLWVYYPMVFPLKAHPISANISPLQLRYTGGWDTLPRPGQRKTVLLRSSPLSRLEGFPRPIDLQLAGQQPDQSQFEGKGGIPLGVLIEGEYRSFYTNKVKPFSLPAPRDRAEAVRILAVADGDVIVNQFDDQGRPLELGYDKWTSSYYGNKAFLLNAVHYLMGQDELLLSRGKAVTIPRLDPLKIKERLGFWQWINMGIPLLLLTVVAGIWLPLRDRRYRVPIRS